MAFFQKRKQSTGQQGVAISYMDFLCCPRLSDMDAGSMTLVIQTQKQRLCVSGLVSKHIMRGNK